jgi:hypothetical protein
MYTFSLHVAASHPSPHYNQHVHQVALHFGTFAFPNHPLCATDISGWGLVTRRKICRYNQYDLSACTYFPGMWLHPNPPHTLASMPPLWLCI